MIRTVLTAVFAIGGVTFLVLAGVGILRFGDALQRMHASTKAGTVGAGLVLVAAILAHGTTGAVIVGGMAVVFLLSTLPVAAHLLGRAAYVSGASLAPLQGDDALVGVLERQPMPLEDRIGRRNLEEDEAY